MRLMGFGGGEEHLVTPWCFSAGMIHLGRSDGDDLRPKFNGSAPVWLVFCNRIRCVKDFFYKLKINFVFQKLCYFFHYLTSKNPWDRCEFFIAALSFRKTGSI